MQNVFTICGQPTHNSNSVTCFNPHSFLKGIGLPYSFLGYKKCYCYLKISSPFVTTVFDKQGEISDFDCHGIVASINENGKYDFFCIDSYTKPIWDESGECFGCRPVIDNVGSQEKFSKLFQRIVGV